MPDPEVLKPDVGTIRQPEGYRDAAPGLAMPALPAAHVPEFSAGPARHGAGFANQVLPALIDAAKAGPSAKVTTVSLDPVELGRLVIRFHADPFQPLLVLTAERPETLDLMRRNLEILESALRDLGHGGCGIDLGTGQSGDQRTDVPQVVADNDDHPLDPAPQGTVGAPARGQTGRLDLRV